LRGSTYVLLLSSSALLYRVSLLEYCLDRRKLQIALSIGEHSSNAASRNT
jgi:hypothetical protein